MLISKLLSSKGSGVATTTKGATIAEALNQLKLHRVGALVVSGDGARVEGILSERDIVRALVSRGAGLLDETVESVMTTEVFVCGPGDDTEGLMEVMTERRFRHIPVVEDGVLTGIVSIGDVVKNRIEELQRERQEMLEYVGAR